MLPSAPVWLIVAKNLLTDEVKYFVCNASASTSVEKMLHVAFSRWPIERAFQDEKSELGLDHFECRRFDALRRHLILTTISHMFLATMHSTLTQDAHSTSSANAASEEKEKASHASATSPRSRRLDLCMHLDPCSKA